MQIPTMKPLTKAEYEQSERNRQRLDIRFDVKRIMEILKADDKAQLEEMHIFINGKYGAYVPEWSNGMYGYVEKSGFNYELLDKESIIHNLKYMSAKLEGFAMGLNRSTKKSYDSNKNNVNVTVNNMVENDVDISISITFEQARQEIENMTSLTNEQTREILDKITEIENTVNGSGTKKSKWEKIKPILTWLADKSFDVGMTLLPLLLKIGG